MTSDERLYLVTCHSSLVPAPNIRPRLVAREYGSQIDTPVEQFLDSRTRLIELPLAQQERHHPGRAGSAHRSPAAAFHTGLPTQRKEFFSKKTSSFWTSDASVPSVVKGHRAERVASVASFAKRLSAASSVSSFLLYAKRTQWRPWRGSRKKLLPGTTATPTSLTR